MVEACPLPRDVYSDSLEEFLLFRSLCYMYGQQTTEALPPSLSMISRNDLLQEARQRLWPENLQSFMLYAEQLSYSLGTWPLSALPPPIWRENRRPPAAEICARNLLEEGQGSLWSAVRQVICHIEFEDPRQNFMAQDARARSFSLGVYARQAFVGLCKATPLHPNVCRLLCRFISHVCPSHRWTSLAVHVNYRAPPHTDQHNGPQRSLIMALSLNDEGGLWLQNTEGIHYLEHSGQMLQGTIYSLQDQYLLFSSHEVRHATQSWAHFDRVTLVAYTVRNWPRLAQPMQESLLDLGFNLPDLPAGHLVPTPNLLPTVLA